MLLILSGFNIYSISFGLVLAIVLGGAIGLNREDNNRPHKYLYFLSQTYPCFLFLEML
jgi:hypothetical protein